MYPEMMSSVPVGTLLRQRYVIKQILGQGGFGRTYLAADQERFNEPCVIKEFTVPYQDDALIDKAKTLFQREASILYQIQHPQIPRFWAAFETEQRLFLVQDFVQGQTYRSVLKARKAQGKAFSEEEILYLLNHLLPVLSYLHDRDIIHRDISPENVILQTSAKDGSNGEHFAMQGLPMLIDFGAVKEAASHWPIVSTLTRVGKVGYAPPEQLQTGNVSPHSDIYAVGASCLVLLTGREPQTLLNSQTLTWQWQPYTQMSDRLATVLQKMLALHPGDRYQSAKEAWADLQPLMDGGVKETVLTPEPRSLPFERDIVAAARELTESQIVTTLKTKFLMGSSNQESGTSETPRSTLRPPKPFRKRNPAPGVAIAVSLVIATGIGAKIFQATAFNNQINAETTRSGTGNAVYPISDGNPKKIEFGPGDISKIEPGNLQDRHTQPYLLEASQGQIMIATLDGSGVKMNIRRANKQPIDSSANQTRSWTGQLPANEQYIIEVTGSGAYSLDVAVTPVTELPASANTQRVQFKRGTRATTVTGKSEPNKIRRYIMKAKTRQVMAVRVLKGDLILNINAPNGQSVGGSSLASRNWKGRLLMDGDYVIEVSSSQKGEYALGFEIF
jgi:serine/threonine protein kinase